MATPPTLSVVYGTAEEVAAMASIWTRAGEWIDPAPPGEKGTNPSLTQVETWLMNITAQMNLALGNRYFVTPIDPVTSPNAYLAVSQYVVSLVADLCHFKNSSGRFFTERLVERGITPMAAILKDMANWVAMNEGGLAADGVPIDNSSIPANRQASFRTMGSFPHNQYGSRRWQP